MHDGCRGREWATEGEMRSAHPTHAEMQRTMQAHVFCLLSHAPADPIDPEGPILGYIAPIGRDGTTVRETLASVEDDREMMGDVENLRSRIDAQSKQIADLMALVETLSKTGKK
jgi:hypothetical protein